MSKPIGKGALVALAAVGLAVATISWRMFDGTAAEAAAGRHGAIERLTAAAAADPADAAGWQRLGKTFFDAGRFADAARAFDRATAAEPDDPASWSSLGEALAMSSANRRLPPAAFAAFRKASALDPQDWRARYYLAVKRDIDGDHAGAIDDWLALLAETPAGTPREAELQRTIEQVSQLHGIAVGDRMAAAIASRSAAQP